MKSSIATVRTPDRLRSVNVAPSADSADTQSAAGSAWLTDPPTVATTLDLLELGKTGDIDDQLRLHQPQVEHGTKRLAAGNDPGGCFGLAEHGKCRRQIAWTFVAEGRRFHAAGLSASRAARTASTTR
jgi:hypothetical protein